MCVSTKMYKLIGRGPVWWFRKDGHHPAAGKSSPNALYQFLADIATPDAPISYCFREMLHNWTSHKDSTMKELRDSLDCLMPDFNTQGEGDRLRTNVLTVFVSASQIRRCKQKSFDRSDFKAVICQAFHSVREKYQKRRLMSLNVQERADCFATLEAQCSAADSSTSRLYAVGTRGFALAAGWTQNTWVAGVGASITLGLGAWAAKRASQIWPPVAGDSTGLLLAHELPVDAHDSQVCVE